MKYPQTEDEVRAAVQLCHEIIGKAFSDLARQGLPPTFVNGAAMGMCRKSQQELMGIPKAIEWDRAAREKIGWTNGT